MQHLRHQCERADSARPHTGCEQQIGKVGGSTLGCGGKIAVQTPKMNVARPDVVIRGQNKIRQRCLRRLFILGWLGTGRLMRRCERGSLARDAVGPKAAEQLDLFAP